MVCLTITNSCGEFAWCETISVLTQGINDDNLASGLFISENPSNGEFSKSYPELSSIKIFSADGRVVFANDARDGKALVNITPEAQGVYVVVATTERGQLMKRVVNY